MFVAGGVSFLTVVDLLLKKKRGVVGIVNLVLLFMLLYIHMYEWERNNSWL